MLLWLHLNVARLRLNVVMAPLECREAPLECRYHTNYNHKYL